MISTRALVVVAAGAALALPTACASGSGDAPAPAPVTSVAGAAPAPHPAVPTGGGAGTPTATGLCTTDDLTARLAARPANGYGQHRVAVVWTNKAATACTMTGFGGVDLQGPPDPNGPTYQLPRTSRKPATVRLAPGGHAETVITWLVPERGSVGSNGSVGWTPTRAVATPPDETRSLSMPWTSGPVLRQDSATHPGSAIDPVTAW